MPREKFVLTQSVRLKSEKSPSNPYGHCEKGKIIELDPVADGLTIVELSGRLKKATPENIKSIREEAEREAAELKEQREMELAQRKSFSAPQRRQAVAA